MRTGSVTIGPLLTNRAIAESSKDRTKAIIAAATNADLINGTVTSLKTPAGEAPKLAAARSTFGLMPANATTINPVINGRTSMSWAAARVAELIGSPAPAYIV